MEFFSNFLMSMLFKIFQSINMEEKLLEFEVTPFLELQNMLTAVEPYNQLWHTILEFHKKYEIWYNGMEFFQC